jgi:glycerophosphoryl diester phosphodiesterase
MPRSFATGFLLVAIVIALTHGAVPGGTPAAHVRKQLVAHRGASAYAPEHTLDSYRLAIEQGADFVEQDLAVTNDGVLVCIHDLTLERTTDVEDVFPTRFSRDATGTAPMRRWLVGDFTLAEIKRLDAGSWFGPAFAGARIPTFQEAIDLVKGKAGLYPELKDPAFYRERGVSPETLLAGIIRQNGLAHDPKTPLVIQSFDEATIRAVATALPEVPRVWLIGPAAAGRVDAAIKLTDITAWATGVAPEKAIVAARPEIVTWAHAAGLTVTAWTFRSSNTGPFASVRAEMATFLYEYGVDALFTDNPDQFPRR